MVRHTGKNGRAAAFGKWAPPYFAAAAAAVWAPALFGNGFVLLGDMVFTPAMRPPVSLLGPVRGTMDVALVYNLAWLVSRLIGAVLLQKAVLFLMAFLPGYLMYRNVPATDWWSKVFAGTLYALNPFVYTRMLVGQWGFILGYALLPVVFASCVKTLREPGAGRVARTALWISGAALLSLHAGALALMVLAAVSLAGMARMPRAGRTAIAAISVLALFAVVSAFWLMPALDPGGPGSYMGKADLEAFATRSTSRAGTALSVAGLYGYWKTQLDGLMPRRYVPAWPAFGLLALALCAVGLRRYADEPGRGPGLLALSALAVLAFFLALGSTAPVTGRAFSWLYDNVAFFRLFREPQKFVALLALAYAVVGASGLDALLAGVRSRERGGAPSTASPAAKQEPGAHRAARAGPEPGAVLAVLFIALVALYSFRMFGGLWGQAKAVSYPRSWAQAQERMDRDRGDWYALYLPTFWYQRYEFTGTDYTITNPMPFYFTNRALPLNSIDVGAVSLGQQPLDGYVQSALDSGRKRGNLGAMLAPLNVKYVLMARNQASVLFEHVYRQRDLEVVGRWDDLVLLKNLVPVGRLTLARGFGTFKDWGSVGEAASGSNLSGSRITASSQTSIAPLEGMPLKTAESEGGRIVARVPLTGAPGKLNLMAMPAPGLLVGEPYDRHWSISGQTGGCPARQLGVTMAFAAVPGTTVTIRYFYLLLWLGYAFSIGGALVCIALVARRVNRDGTVSS